MNKNAFYAFVLLALSPLIVPLVINSVNRPAIAHIRFNSVLFATGQPMPPPVPPAVNDSTLVVTGQPMPPPVPPFSRRSLTVA